MKKIILLLFAILAFFAIAAEPSAELVRGIPKLQLDFNKTLPQMFYSPSITGNLGTTPIATGKSLLHNAVIEKVYIVVSDTVESRGDSAVVAVKINGVTILSQATSAFKLPNYFAFDPVTPKVSAGALTYTITQAGSGAGITEGTWKIYIRYFNP